MKFKKITSIIVLCCFLIGMFGSTALAMNGIKKVSLDAGSATVTIKFKDIKDAVWAFKHVSRMAAEDVIKGYRDGSFKPNNHVTRAEAVVLAVKAVGLESEVEAVSDSVYLPYKDSKAIPSWAKRQLAVAIQKGFVDTTNQATFQPNKPASREWVAKLIVTAFGLKEEALAKTDVQLPFKDEASISPDAAGFIAVAVERGIITGMPNGTFQPNKPVTRAQIAVMLGLSADQAGIKIKKGKAEAYVLGTNVSSDVYSQDSVASSVYYQGTITLDFKNEAFAELTLPVAKDAVIYINDKQAKLSDIATGSRVEVIIRNNVVVYIEIQPTKVRGVTQAVYNNNITIITKERKQIAEKTYNVSPEAAVKINGKKAVITDLKAGSFCILTLNEKNTVVSIMATVFEPKLKHKENKHDKNEIKSKVQLKEKIKEQAKKKAEENGKWKRD